MSSPPIQSADWAGFISADAAYRRPRPSILYQLSLLPVGLMMILLPVIYVALIALAAYATYYHGTHNYNRIMSWGGRYANWRFELFKVVIYATPLVTGMILVFFMVKPIFARPGRRAQPYALNAEVEPRLSAFIGGICQMIGAPAPKRIDLNCDLNAAASFRRGFRSFFGRDLVLTLGLPLVATLSVEEFACILAHEFGHFTQGVGMRASYVIRSINFWFARVVFQRDAWDEMLDDWERTAEGFSAIIIVAAAKLGVFISRLVLHLLMLVGQALSSAMDRQQEYNADAFAINAVGSEVFEKMIRRMALLDFANTQCLAQMQAMWKQERALPDNFPLLLANRVDATPPELKTSIDDRLGLRKTGLLDTHPCDADRIRQARRLGEPGIIRSDGPAAGLFENFPVPAQFVTLFHYQALGIPITRDGLRNIPLTKTEQAQARAGIEELLERYFCGLTPLMHPISVTAQELSAPADAAAARQDIRDFRPRLAAISGQIGEVVQQFRQAPDVETQEGCRRALRAVMEEFHKHFATTLALQDDEEARDETRRLAAFLRKFAEAWPLLEQCRREQSSLAANKDPESARRLNDLLYKLREATVTLSDPLDPRKQTRGLYDRFAGGTPDSADPEAVASVAGAAINGFTGLYLRVLGRLVQSAEQFEAVA